VIATERGEFPTFTVETALFVAVSITDTLLPETL
jgi:hypothetical protein